MRLAIATDRGQVAAHFGRCPEYTLVDINEANNVTDQESIANPGHRPDFLPRYLAERHVNVIIAGGMGPRAQSLFNDMGIEPVVGVQGPVDEVIAEYVRGSLEVGESLCEHEEEGD